MATALDLDPVKRRDLLQDVNVLLRAEAGFADLLHREIRGSANAEEHCRELDRARARLLGVLGRGVRERACTADEAAILGSTDLQAAAAMLRSITREHYHREFVEAADPRSTAAA
jgi:hypothetical protein